jgi:hypothetical protein
VEHREDLDTLVVESVEHTQREAPEQRTTDAALDELVAARQTSARSSFPRPGT